MRKLLGFLIFVLLSVSFVVGQTKRKPTTQKPAAVTKIAEAEKAWIPFWGNFQDVVKKRNREKLSRLESMDSDKRNSGDFDWKTLSLIMNKGRLAKITNFDGDVSRSLNFYRGELNCVIWFKYEKNIVWRFLGFGCDNE